MTRLFLAALLCLAGPTFAQSDDDAPIPYDDDGEDNKAAPTKMKRSRETLREEEEEEVEAEETLTHLDDPNIGVGAEFLPGLMLLESSKGAGTEPRFMYGFRFTWEWGRLIPDEYLREMFFADVAWQYTAYSDGTPQVHTDTNYHYFTLAPAFAIPFGKSFMSAYAQLGIGFNYSTMSQYVDTTQTNLSGTKFLFQYGIGLRGRPAILADGSVRISFRVELTRFIRGYMHDTFLGVGVGMIF
ncbi:MAG: hypothetical protein AMXMBFR34_47680 [Myxococcaceae bacterium]